MKNARITKLKVKKKKGYYEGGEADPNSLYNNINRGQTQNLAFQGPPPDAQFNINNASSMAGAGSMFGPAGTAIGGGLGLGLDVLNYNKNKKATDALTTDIRNSNAQALSNNNPYAQAGFREGGMPEGEQAETASSAEESKDMPTDQILAYELDINDVPEFKNVKLDDHVAIYGYIDKLENGKLRVYFTDFEVQNEQTAKPLQEGEEPIEEEGTEYVAGGTVYEYKKGGWIQKATASIKRRGTKGKCTPITKPGCTGRAKALAKTFKAMAKNKEDGGSVGKYDDGGTVTPNNISPKLKRNVYTVIANYPTHGTETTAMKHGGEVPGELKALFDKCMKQAGGDKEKAKLLVKQYLSKK